jgi:hypothetical protein
MAHPVDVIDRTAASLCQAIVAAEDALVAAQQKQRDRAALYDDADAKTREQSIEKYPALQDRGVP